MPDITLTTAPAVEPVTLAQARLQLRLDDDYIADDELIETLLIPTARQQCEHETGRRLITQTWEFVLDAFPCGAQSIRLPWGLVRAQSVDAVTYLDTAGDWQTLAADTYALDALTLPGYLFPAARLDWPVGVADSADAVRIRIVCGYGDTAAEVPHALRQWMLLQVATLYRNRETFAAGVSVTELPGRFAGALLDPFRVSHC